MTGAGVKALFFMEFIIITFLIMSKVLHRVVDDTTHNFDKLGPKYAAIMKDLLSLSINVRKYKKKVFILQSELFHA